MDINKKIDKIINHIFENYGFSETISDKPRLLIHDNIHGTLKFQGFERKLINSPIIQRLTHIKQMGLASYVYPGATHNRFTHSLGVSNLSKRIYENIKDNNQEDINTLRLAGLLHDIGHGPFSHLTDKVYSIVSSYPKKFPDNCNEIFDEPDRIGIETNIHEYIAFHFIENKSMKGFLKDLYKDVNINLDLVPLCITGNQIPYKNKNNNYSFDLDEDDTLLIKIINGFSDADKIDYILRDSHFTGLPLPIDFQRLLPFFTTIKNHDSFELGVSQKGARAFHLLLQSKSKMFPTVYQHHTTLACESLLLFGIVNSIYNVKEFSSKLDKEIYIPIKSPIDLLYYTDYKLLNYLKIIENPISNDVIRRLFTRRHYRIALRVFLWDLKRRLTISYDEFKKTCKNGDNIDELYDKKVSSLERKVFDFAELFTDPDSIFKIKEQIFEKVSWNEIEEKLSQDLKKVEKNVLIEYIIHIAVAEEYHNRPYTEPYIKIIDVFTGKKELISLEDMGFRGPDDEEILQTYFYVLPEFLDILKPHIIDFVKNYFDPKYFE
ncbi:MAG: HD domain-containing protein [Candidatus Lokiarchaeota archaeon]|nr:HD domain-containing protein [Candidatus Lokiarchaeota archaeon]